MRHGSKREVVRFQEPLIDDLDEIPVRDDYGVLQRYVKADSEEAELLFPYRYYVFAHRENVYNK